MVKRHDIDTSHFPTFGDYLKESGRQERVSIAVEKMSIALQLAHQMDEQKVSKSEMAERMGTSRAQLDRVLNPASKNVTLESLARAAAVLGRRLQVKLL